MPVPVYSIIITIINRKTNLDFVLTILIFPIGLQARPMEGLVLLDELEAAVDEDKRQFDDYGHMRFGKRGPQQQAAAFDDYGHMRFGRSGSD